MEFFACFHEFYNMGKKNRGVKKSHQTKNLKFAIQDWAGHPGVFG